jgi:hypothetical protein
LNCSLLVWSAIARIPVPANQELAATITRPAAETVRAQDGSVVVRHFASVSARTTAPMVAAMPATVLTGLL